MLVTRKEKHLGKETMKQWYETIQNVAINQIKIECFTGAWEDRKATENLSIVWASLLNTNACGGSWGCSSSVATLPFWPPTWETQENNGGLSTWCHTNAQEYRIQEGNVLNADSFASTTVKWLTLLKGDPAGSLRKQHSKGSYENLDLLTSPVNFNCWHWYSTTVKIWVIRFY